MRRPQLLWLPILGIVAIGTHALASDEKVFSGSMCSFSEQGHYDGQDRGAVKLLNSSGQTETVSCPLKRDRADQAILGAYVIASAQVDEDTCKLWARNDDFTFSTWSHDGVESAGPDYNKTKFATGAATLYPDDWASLQITCDLPNDARVVNYYLNEN